MKNLILHEARRISLPVPADTPSGAPVKVGSLIGVTATAEGEGGNAPGRATVWREGEYTFPVAGAVASEGLPVYITSANALTATATDNTLFGYSHGTKGTGTGPLPVILAQV
jgi:predicted RecA/RadA family phage recombinase